MSWDELHDLTQLRKEHEQDMIDTPQEILRAMIEVLQGGGTDEGTVNQIRDLIEEGATRSKSREMKMRFGEMRNILNQIVSGQYRKSQNVDTPKLKEIFEKLQIDPNMSKCDAKKILKSVNQELRRREGISVNQVCDLVCEEPIPPMKKIAGDSIKIWDDGTWT